MFGKPGFGLAIDNTVLRRQRVAISFALLQALALHCVELRAELLFRNVEQAGGQQTWSAIKRYGDSADTAYPRATARGTAVSPQEVRVFLSGEISQADVRSARVMASLLSSGQQKIVGNTVWLASNGGDIDAGMDLGRLLRKLGVFTVVARNDQCFSACVFAFMGGERRSVAGRLGIHRPFFPFTQDTPDRHARFRHLQKTVKDFVEELDFPASLYEAVMLVPPESIQIIEPADLKRYYLEGISPSTEDMVDAAAARRLDMPMAEYLRRKAKTPPCAFFDAGEGRCEGKVQEAVANGSAADPPGSMKKGDLAATGTPTGRGTKAAQGSM